ncbi:MAG: hypothetical protein AB7P69_27185 [Candidatus Binatia bacterium]
MIACLLEPVKRRLTPEVAKAIISLRADCTFFGGTIDGLWLGH